MKTLPARTRKLFLTAKLAGWLALALSMTPAMAGLVYFSGTGHWYEAVNVPAGITWNESYTNAINRGGYLCTITNASENTFVASLVDSSFYSDASIHGDILGPWLGGFRHAGDGNWQWLTGEAFNYAPWYPGQPDGYGGSEQRLQFYAGAGVGLTWGDHPGDPISGYSLPRGYIVEYDQLLRLSIGQSNDVAVIAWPQPSQGWVLEMTPSLPANTNAWNTVATNLYQTNLTSLFITVTNRTGTAFYRLRH